MVLEVGLLGEAARADGTLERPVSVVGVGVRLEVARGRKRLEADGALVWLVLRVRHPVVVEVGGGGEPLAAGRTLVRLLACDRSGS